MSNWCSWTDAGRMPTKVGFGRSTLQIDRTRRRCARALRDSRGNHQGPSKANGKDEDYWMRTTTLVGVHLLEHREREAPIEAQLLKDVVEVALDGLLAD